MEPQTALPGGLERQSAKEKTSEASSSQPLLPTQEPQKQQQEQQQDQQQEQQQEQQQQQQQQQQQLVQPKEDSFLVCTCRALLQKHGALGEDGLFEDPDFPPLHSEDSTHPPVCFHCGYLLCSLFVESAMGTA